MRKTVLVILLVLSSTCPVQAGLLTRGNLAAEGLAGCALGMGIGWAGGVLPPAEMLTAKLSGLPRVGLLGSCLLGATFGATLSGIAFLVDIGEDFINPNRPLETMTNMVYPETPGH